MKHSARFEQLYRAEQSAFAATVSNYRAAAETAAPPTGVMRKRVASEKRAINQGAKMISKFSLAAARALAERLRIEARAVQPIAAVAQQRQCPAYPLPPEALIKAPLKTDFLTRPPRNRAGYPARRTD